MRTTWWQKFWRWAVVLELLLVVNGAIIVDRVYRTMPDADPARAGEAAHWIAVGLWGFAWGMAATAAHALLLVSVPMLVVVEVSAWCHRRAWRRRADREMHAEVAAHFPRRADGFRD